MNLLNADAVNSIHHLLKFNIPVSEKKIRLQSFSDTCVTYQEKKFDI